MEEPTQELSFHHFSHDHPLTCTKSPPKLHSTCFGCNLSIFPGNSYYKCKTCPFYLHQVCYNMPLKAQHPADPNHHFTLQSIPPSSNATFNCKACGNHIANGFYYNCSKCEDYYHILCSAAPLSVRTPSHHHKLVLQYSPPYDFQCDLCKKSSFSGWLYHCGICEFDAHLACAISNKGVHSLQHQLVPLPSFSTSKRDELMELLTRGAKAVGDTKNDLEMVVSDDSNLLSYQFSDACFSIDFAESLLGNNKEHYTMENIAEVKETMSGRNSNAPSFSNIKDAKEEGKKCRSPTVLSPRIISSDIKLDVQFSTGIGAYTRRKLEEENQKGKANRSRDMPEAVDESSGPDTVSFRCSIWSKFPMRFFCLRRGTKASKNRRK